MKGFKPQLSTFALEIARLDDYLNLPKPRTQTWQNEPFIFNDEEFVVYEDTNPNYDLRGYIEKYEISIQDIHPQTPSGL